MARTMGKGEVVCTMRFCSKKRDFVGKQEDRGRNRILKH